ncbi:FAM96B [Neurospora crassa OR74A]|uniref:FAM96B n=1 Tax=Neurospora crassa (strain ATCC 24698 / 74-OR23-1A / CBS 708.71 / DSM 1257 / FGSC 987) TaxID=367110 RepID=V5IRG6_NEUCR|nr:FAM96B, variant [Neurospora crassa OR74A]XP_011392966.1 FAM96B [Neurospora crassa OR74A]ESA43916.1 FAM96B [Neurospora crassa OR74A]ESA43917.1 FAM96B, variant [Neurospora crassa OR74A]|eukprot:XP_011392965.1 FAM96B, variant [Neurospora crassa OR74A]
MAKSDLDNANPTVLSVSQLPSRNLAKGHVRKGPDSKYDHILFPKQWWAGSSLNTDPSVWTSDEDEDDDLTLATEEPIDEQEIYDLLSTISDPEHPVTLGQIAVVRLDDIHLSPSPAERLDPNTLTNVEVDLTPTVNHCSLATVIGLAVRVRLENALPPNYRIIVRMKDGSHAQDDQVNKQLGDKERVAAALENDTLKGIIEKMLETCV